MKPTLFSNDLFADEYYDMLTPEYHDAISISLGELLESGELDWNNPSWQWDKYDDVQYARVCEKINNRYYSRNIGVLPASRWKRELLRKINETMPKLKPLYAALEKNSDIIMSDSDTYGKTRSVFSDLPATQIQDNADYASNATDNQFETIVNGPYLNKAAQIAHEYDDIDVILLDAIQSCFSCLLTTNLNNY